MCHSQSKWGRTCLYIFGCAFLLTAAPSALAQKISFKSAAGAPIPGGPTPSSVVSGDFNRDNVTDFAVVNTDGNSVSVFLGNGDGTFHGAPNSPYAVNTGFATSGIPIAITTGDFNNDGILDLAVTNLRRDPFCDINALISGNVCSDVAVLLGNPDGSFQGANNFDPGGHLPTSVAAADFDGDGNLDLAITNFNDNSVSILLGDGSGKNFKQANGSPFHVGVRPVFIVAEKFNGDGVWDLAVANADDHNVWILLGNGDGTFALASGSPIGVGTRPVGLATGDFNGDTKKDLAVVDFTDSTVTILLGNGDGTFSGAGAVGVGANPVAVVAADFNSDGKLDLAAVNRLSNRVSILRGNGNGSFSLSTNISTGIGPQSIAFGDFNGDHQPDLAVTNSSGNSISVLLNTTDIIPPTSTASANPGPNGNGWNNTPVTVTISATDNAGGSGVKEIHYTIAGNSEVVTAGSSVGVTLSAQGSYSISYHAVDNAGNVESAHSLTVQIDLTNPTITSSQSPAANGAGWNNSNVTVSFACADDFSGVATCTSPITVSTEGANQTISGSVTDKAGNSASTSRVINLDKTPPVLTMPVLAASYLLNATATFTFSATDALSGLASSHATLNGNPISSGTTLTLTHLGTNTFVLSATDVAGNTATQTATFTVNYKFGGFLPPVPPDGSGVFKLGSTVPVKFQLTDANGALVSTAVAQLTLQMISGGVPVGTPIDATAPGNADSGNLFRFDSTQYIYNLSTKPLSVGTWQLQVRLDDGTVHTVAFGTK